MTEKDQAAFPLFAYVDKDDHSFSEGLTKREYFANNAPDQIPLWFKHQKIAKDFKNPPTWEDIKDEKDAEEVRQWQNDPIYDLPDHLMWFQDAINKHYDEKKAYELKDAINRFFQWRTFYADNLINELNTNL